VVGTWEFFNDEHEKDWTPKLAPIINKQFDIALKKPKISLDYSSHV